MNLSRMEPSGQAMFVMLLIGPQTTNMPGVQPVGRLAFAEMLEWEPEAFDKAFQEVFEQGLAKADWKARFVFVPKSIQHNLPQSPNVVKSWASTWARVPDCDLKREAWQTIFQALTALGKSFADAFKTACPLDFDDDLEAAGKDTGKASGKPSEKATDNQEQEKEQKQEQEKEIQGASAPRTPDSDSADGVVAENPNAPAADGETRPGAGPAGQPGDGAGSPADDSLPRALGVRELVAEGVERQHALDWLKVRKEKKAPLTPTAWDDVKDEAKKAGITPAEAVKVSATNSWQGFKAKWYARLQQEGQPMLPTGRSTAHGGFDQRDYGTGGRL